VCEWIDEDEFRTLLKLFNYVGREHGCSIFRLERSKLAKSIDSVDEVLEMLKRYAEDPIHAVAVVRSALDELKTAYVDVAEDSFLVRSRLRISSIVEELRSRGIHGISYSRELQGYLVKPYALLDLVDLLEEEGFSVNDNTGLLTCGEINAELRVQLRPYQREALEEWLKRRRGVVVLPTGAGKTVIGLAAIVATRCPSLIVVYTKEQMFQWFEKIRSMTTIPQSMIGLFYGESKLLRPITIVTYQSAVRHIDAIARKFKLLIVDEAHHLPAQKFRTIATRVLAPYRLALSATPYRDDGLHEELFKLMGGIVYAKSAHELAREGYIASFIVVPVRVSMSVEERKTYRKLMDELSRYPTLRDLELGLEVDPGTLGKAYRLINALRKFLATMESKLNAVERIVKLELSRGSKIIVFTEYVDYAEKIASRLHALLLTGRMSESLRIVTLSRFRSAPSAVLVTTTVGDEGLDVVDANVGIIMSTLISRRQFVQRLGRLLRPKEGKLARLYVLVARGTFEERKLREKLLPGLSITEEPI
jgi:superfamily II DNA or RNA helicase